jgi:S1-C subfamily serine protease
VILAALAMPPIARAQPPSPAPSPTPPVNAVPELGQRFFIAHELTLQAPLDAVVHNDPANPARYVRARLKVADRGQGGWYVTVRDASHRPLEVLTPADFGPGGVRWTGRIPGREVRLELSPASAETQGVRVRVEEYIAMPATARKTYYSLQSEQPTYRPLFPGEEPPAAPAETDTARRALGDGVAFLMGASGNATWCCSGVLVGDDLLLTNWHCGAPPAGLPASLQWGKDICSDTLLDLSWDGDLLSREFACTRVLAQDRDRDYALLRLTPVGPSSHARPVTLRTTAPVAGEPLVAVHHPACLPKRITTGCSVADASFRSWTGALADSDLTHKCDTEAGSSGGAVFDLSGRLLGLHHRGFAEADDPDVRQRKVNAAVRVDQILAHLAATHPEILPELRRAP